MKNETAKYYIYSAETIYSMGAVLSKTAIENNDFELYAELWCDCVPAILDRLSEGYLKIEIDVPCENATAVSMCDSIRQCLEDEHLFKEHDYRFLFHEAMKNIEYSRRIMSCDFDSQE